MKFLREFDPEQKMYCNVAAAVLGAGVLGAGASIYGANKAAGAQTDASNAAIANSNATYAKNQQTLAPYINAGNSATGQLQSWLDPTSSSNPLSSLIKLTTPGADQSATLAQTPGYQFAQGQGDRAIMNALAGRGLAGSTGAIATNVGNFTNGLASTTWQNVVNALSGVVGQETNGLQGLVSTGGNAAGALTGSANTSMNSVNSALTGAGNAQAAAANTTGSALSGAAGSLSTAAILQQLTGSKGGSIYGNVGAMPATGAGSPTDFQSNTYAMGQGINPFG